MFRVTMKTYDYNNEGEVTNTNVVLQQDSPLCIIPAGLQGDHRNTSDTEVQRLALEDFYNKVFPNRAENEKFTKVDDEIAKVFVMAEENRVRFGKMLEDFKKMKADLPKLVAEEVKKSKQA